MLQLRIKRYNIVRWAEEFIDRLGYIKMLQEKLSANRLTGEITDKLLADYIRNSHRLLFLDYDGTLMPFQASPELAKPGKELYALLSKLSEDAHNKVVIVSGRKRFPLTEWMEELKVDLVAEHGVWRKEYGHDWIMPRDLSSEWKKEILPVMELYVDRTPGAFVEHKDYSLAWHYRLADPELGYIRAKELMDNLLSLTANLDLQVMEGHKVVEVKSAGVNKGKAVEYWMEKEPDAGFILAAGDDWTDEDMFQVMPKSAYTIKVGWSPSAARYRVDSPSAIHSMLEQLVR